MLFGSLISSTDPVATLAILKSVGAPPLLYDLVFGESALNDALSIVLFNIFRRRCQKEFRHELQKEGNPEGITYPDSPTASQGQGRHLVDTSLPAARINEVLSSNVGGASPLSPDASLDAGGGNPLAYTRSPSASGSTMTHFFSAVTAAASTMMPSTSPLALSPTPLGAAGDLAGPISSPDALPGSVWASAAAATLSPSPPLLPMPPSPPPGPPWFEPMLPSMGLTFERLVKILPLSLLMGVMAGLSTAVVTKKLGLHRQAKAYAELSLILVAALLTYTLTDSLQLSGILSLFFSGITMRHYTYYNLSPAAQATARTLFATVSSLSDIALSLILGVALVDYTVHGLSDEIVVSGVRGKEVWDWSLIGCSAPILLMARAVNIFPLSELANSCVRKLSRHITSRVSSSLAFHVPDDSLGHARVCARGGVLD